MNSYRNVCNVQLSDQFRSRYNTTRGDAPLWMYSEPHTASYSASSPSRGNDGVVKVPIRRYRIRFSYVLRMALQPPLSLRHRSARVVQKRIPDRAARKTMTRHIKLTDLGRLVHRLNTTAAATMTVRDWMDRRWLYVPDPHMLRGLLRDLQAACDKPHEDT